MAIVSSSTWRIPHADIHLLVTGPAMAAPTLVAAITSPASAYDPKMCSACMMRVMVSKPPGARATS